MRINMTGTDSDISDTELPVRTCRAKKKCPGRSIGASLIKICHDLNRLLLLV